MEALKLTLEVEDFQGLHTILDVNGILKKVGTKELWLSLIELTLVASLKSRKVGFHIVY
jgi:hypothetical protein